jgi:uncharacterized protein YlzI (FlbEa/FlbD family)
MAKFVELCVNGRGYTTFNADRIEVLDLYEGDVSITLAGGTKYYLIEEYNAVKEILRAKRT